VPVADGARWGGRSLPLADRTYASANGLRPGELFHSVTHAHRLRTSDVSNPS
jgi:hypothetical protein